MAEPVSEPSPTLKLGLFLLHKALLLPGPGLTLEMKKLRPDEHMINCSWLLRITPAKHVTRAPTCFYTVGIPEGYSGSLCALGNRTAHIFPLRMKTSKLLFQGPHGSEEAQGQAG